MIKSEQVWQVHYHMNEYRNNTRQVKDKLDRSKSDMIRMIQESFQVSNDLSKLEALLPEGFTVLRPVTDVYGFSSKPKHREDRPTKSPQIAYGFGVDFYLCFNGEQIKHSESAASEILNMEAKVMPELERIEQKYDLWLVRLTVPKPRYEGYD
jgi:hypothetical protein